MIEAHTYASVPSAPAQTNAKESAFDSFLRQYSKGGFATMLGVERPKELADPTYSCSSDIASSIHTFYQNNGFLPPVPSPSRFLEQEREIALHRYGLDDPSAWESIQRCARLTSTLFKCPAAVSIVHSDRVVIGASAGFSLEPGSVIKFEESACSHSALLSDGSLHQVPDVANDWRLANLPGLPKSYFGQPVCLPASDGGPRVPVAVLCLLDDKTNTYKTPEEAGILSDLSEMLSQQIVCSWQSERRLKEEKMRSFVSNLMSTAVLKQSTFSSLTETEPSGISEPRLSQEPSSSVTMINHAAQNLRELLGCDFAAVLDLHALHLTWQTHKNKRTGNFGWLQRQKKGSYLQGEESTKPHEAIKILGYGISERCRKQYSPTTAFNSITAMNALSTYLQEYVGQEEPVFSQLSEGSSLQPLLPKGTRSHISIPLFNADQPDLLVIVTTQTPYHKFEPADLTFASNVTHIIQSHQTRIRLMQADAAKTTFLSVISHELRTPLHGLLCQLELIREASLPAQLLEISPLLDTAECCGLALRDVLNDVLEYGKMELTDNETPSSITDSPSRKRQTSLVDITSLATEVLNMSYGRRLQWHSVSSENEAPMSGVEVSMVYEDLPCGWEAEVDVAGLRRVLFNLVSNALKYTPKGSITLDIREEPATIISTTDSNLRHIQFTVSDTGVGMSESFQKNLFTPFSQEDSFNPGSGLGLSICQGILKRMQGEIDVQSEAGVGTTVRVGLQVKFSRDAPRRAPSDPPRTMLRKIISGDRLSPLTLSKSLSTPPPQPTLPPTPPTPTHVSLPRPIPLPLKSLPNLPPPSPPSPIQDIRVLVVDDNSIGRKVLTTLLRRRKVAFAEASDGLEALSVFRIFRPDLVWTDVSMPVMNGVESAKHMREIERELGIPPARIVAITGLSNVREMKEGLLGEAAIDEWLVKGQADLKMLSSGLDSFRKSRRKQ